MGCVKLHILDEQYKNTELKVCYFNKEPTQNFCAENPRRCILVNAIDPDGRLVVFINGMHGGGHLNTHEMADYWRKNGVFFDLDVMEHLNDFNPLYRDGSVGGWANVGNNKNADYRFEHGKTQGTIDAGHIMRRISDSDGNIKETIKIITHSMGAAYAKGYIQGLIEAGVPINLIEFEADFAPYQPKKQEAVNGVKTYQFSHSNDQVAKSEKMAGAIYMDTSTDARQDHAIKTFWNQVQNLPAGNYRVENGQIVAM